jgi:hypothetical protein
LLPRHAGSTKREVAPDLARVVEEDDHADAHEELERLEVERREPLESGRAGRHA